MIVFRKFAEKDTEEAARLMVDVYKKYNHLEASNEGLQGYIHTVHPKHVPHDVLFKKLNKPVALVAVDKKKIIGVVRGTPERINSLFVDGKYQGQGIGKQLVNLYFREAKKKGATFIKVRSSVLAVPFYQSMGFKKTTGLRKPHGMKMYNMKLVF